MAIKILPTEAMASPRLLAAWAAGPAAPPRTRQCGSCAYAGKFADAPAYEKEYHLNWLTDPEHDGAHRCHEEPEVRCAGCARWTKEALSLPSTIENTPTS